MQVVEQFQAARTESPDVGADRVLVVEHFAAVVDGAGTHGAVTAEFVCAAIRTFPPALNAMQAVKAMTNCLHAAATRPTGAASVLLYSAARRELWSIGDCQYMCGDVLHRPMLAIDSVLAHLRALVLADAHRRGRTVAELMASDPGRAAIEPFLAMQPGFANASAASVFAYGVINGAAVPSRLIHVHRVPQGIDEVVLASDGYPSLQPTLAASESALAMLLERDPLRMQEPPATKGLRPGDCSYDDRAYLRIRV